jgi:hypothetical protein
VKAQQLLLQYVRQARLNQGDKPAPKATSPAPVPASIHCCGVELKGPTVVLLVDTTRPNNDAAADYAHREVANALRALTPAIRVNVCLSGSRLPNAGSLWLFKEPQPADETARRQAVEFIARAKPKSPAGDGFGDEPRLDARLPVEPTRTLAAILQGWPKEKDGGAGDICFICFDKGGAVPDSDLQAVRSLSGRGLRVHVISEVRISDLSRLAQASRGAEVLLESDGSTISPRRVKPPPK